MDTYISPFTDFGFKKLFGEEASKPFLIDFLNSVFGDFLPHITELNYAKNEQLGATPLDRNAIFDIYCKSDKGEHFIIELQKAEQRYFKQRTLYYSSFAIQGQNKKGQWDFNLLPIYCIGILNFTFHADPNRYIHYGEIINPRTQECLINELKFAYIECPKFKKPIRASSSMQDKWLYILTKIQELDEDLPPALQEKVFERFFEHANVIKLSKTDKKNYDRSLKYYRDMHNVLETAITKGIKKGMEKGIEKGKKESALAIAKKMKDLGVAVDIITQTTGLNAHDVEKI